MSIIFILIIISLFLAILFLIGFFWAVRSGQYDDSYTPAMRILFDDNSENNKNNCVVNQTSTNKK